MIVTINNLNANVLDSGINIFSVQNILGDSSINLQTKLIICRADKLIQELDNNLDDFNLTVLRDDISNLLDKRQLLADLAVKLEHLAKLGLSNAVIGDYTITLNK